jgi:hypothetical protein
MSWQSMDSAPHDGRRFLAFEDGVPIYVAYREFETWWEDGGYKCCPEFWHELPDYPHTPLKEEA